MFKVDIKKISGDDDKKNKIAVVSSIFLQNDGNKIIVNNRTLTYIKGAIKSIISFPNLISKFVDEKYKKHWYYYLYIDEFLTYPINDIISKCIENDEHEKNIIRIFYQLLDNLINEIKTDTKYKNIIIYSFKNKDLTTNIGHLNFYGTLTRYLDFTNKSIDYLIIRNARSPLSPIDVIIQNDWIKSEKDFMIYFNKNYTFNEEDKQQKIIKNLIKKLNLNDNHIYYEIIKENAVPRFYAALLSFKLNSDNCKIIINRLKSIDSIIKKLNINNLPIGIDEIILPFIYNYDIFTFENTYIINLVNNNNINEYLSNKIKKTFHINNNYIIRKIIRRLTRGTVLPIKFFNIDTEKILLDCNNFSILNLIMPFDEYKNIGFATYYKENNKLYKYNYKNLDVSNVNTNYEKNYNWLTIGTDIFLYYLERNYTFDKENNNFKGQILPNNQLHKYVSNINFKPFNMKFLKLYFVDLSVGSDSKSIANHIYKCIKNNIMNYPLVMSSSKFTMKSKPKLVSTKKKSSKQINNYDCIVKPF